MSKYVKFDEFFAYCHACQDVWGQPTKTERRNVQRHLDSNRHKDSIRRALSASTTRQQDSPDHKQPLQQLNTHLKSTSVSTSTTSPHTMPPFLFTYPSTNKNPFDTLSDSNSNMSDIDGDEIDYIGDLFVESSRRNSRDSQQRFEEDNISESDEDSIYESEPELILNTARLGLDYFKPTPSSPPWPPWKNKTVFLADALSNSRRLRFSNRALRAILHFARECTPSDVPSLKALRKAQSELNSKLGDLKEQKTSARGNIFYLNPIAPGIAKNFANPILRKYMNFYPHVNNKRMSQVWHGTKMLENAPDCLMTPMFRVGRKIFYVNELVRRRDDWFLPLRWVLYGKSLTPYAIGLHTQDTTDGLLVLMDKRVAVPISTFQLSYVELAAENKLPCFHIFEVQSADFECQMPHPLRLRAGMRPVYSVPLMVFVDDASGNVSKQWNKHNCCYVSNGALPREILHAEANVQFVSTSPHASPLEILQAVKEDIESTLANPVVAFDCETQEEVLIQLYALFFPADNPMQAEECDGQPLNASHNCRTCEAGGTDDYKRSELGYATLFKPGAIRSPVDTLHKVNRLLDLAVQPKQKTRIKNLARDWGVKDTLAWPVIEHLIRRGAQLRKPVAKVKRQSENQIRAQLEDDLAAARVKGCVNPLLSMTGVDIHKDTPTEILHTVLLGVVKYFWGQTAFILEKKKQLDVFEARLGSLSVSGLSAPKIPARFICNLRGSLTGKHFKILTQVMPFACYDLLGSELLNIWLLLGRLTILLWQTEILELDAYLITLEGVIDSLLKAVAECSPSIMVLKPKLHFLLHLPLYIKRFGPALIFSTERFESFHGVFRGASTHTNRHAPSRDIAEIFVGLDRLKHICAGGYWNEAGTWVSASTLVTNYIARNKDFARLVGIQIDAPIISGSVTLLSRSQRGNPLAHPQNWTHFSTHHLRDQLDPPGTVLDQYFPIASFVSQSGDTVRPSDSILFGSDFGQIISLFCCVSANAVTSYFAAVKKFTVEPQLHQVLNMPALIADGHIVCIHIEDVQCLINVQHNCTAGSRCKPGYISTEVQERSETNRPLYRITHQHDGHYILNTYGLHNAQLISKAVPNHLTGHSVSFPNPDAMYRAATQKLASAAHRKAIVARARKEARDHLNTALDDDLSDTRSSPEPPKRHRKKRRRDSLHSESTT